MVHTNERESFWAMLKHGCQSTFHHINEKNLHRYVNKFAGCHNIRAKDTIDQMQDVVA